ncbi:MAG: hypothetical protein ACYC5G_05160 [Candidatus Doudnabacteria bacterium]
MGDKIYATADFRTHWKYSKRIYHAFKYVWWILHFWDWLIADRFLPKLSFGLFTLTKSPDPGSGLTTCDGWITRYNCEYTSVIDLAQDQVQNVNWGLSISQESAVIGYLVANSTPINTWNSFQKAFFLFDTSSLSSFSSIISAKISLFIFSQVLYTYPAGTIGLFSANTASANNLVTADYFTVGNSLLANTISYIGEQKYYDFILNAGGISVINKTGTSKYATMYDWGRDNSITWVGYGYANTVAYQADKTGENFDPKLVVEYSIPSTNKIQMII